MSDELTSAQTSINLSRVPGWKTNQPIYSLVALLAFVVSITALILTGRADSNLFLPLVITSVPSLIAAISSERTQRDIRNGVLQEKARLGAQEAINQAQVMTRTGPVATTQLVALKTLLGEIHALTLNQSEALKQLTDSDDKDNPAS